MPHVTKHTPKVSTRSVKPYACESSREKRQQDGQTDRQTYRQTDRQTDTQTDRPKPLFSTFWGLYIPNPVLSRSRFFARCYFNIRCNITSIDMEVILRRTHRKVLSGRSLLRHYSGEKRYSSLSPRSREKQKICLVQILGPEQPLGIALFGRGRSGNLVCYQAERCE